jgi:hypothetical protein
MHLTKVPEIQQLVVAALLKSSCAGATIYQRGRDILLATEHEHGLSRLVIEPDGNMQHLDAGPVDETN